MGQYNNVLQNFVVLQNIHSRRYVVQVSDKREDLVWLSPELTQSAGTPHHYIEH